MDIGQPADYLIGVGLHLASVRKLHPERLASGDNIKGNAIIDASAVIGSGCLLGPDVVIGAGCVVEDGVRLERTTLMSGTRVKTHAFVSNSIIGWNSTIGKWSRVEGGTVFGEDVQLADEKLVNGALVLPHKGIRDNIHAAGKIVM